MTYIFDRVYKRDQNIVRAKVGDAISQAGVNAGVRNTQGTGKKLPGGEIVLFRNKSRDNDGNVVNQQ